MREKKNQIRREDFGENRGVRGRPTARLASGGKWIFGDFLGFLREKKSRRRSRHDLISDPGSSSAVAVEEEGEAPPSLPTKEGIRLPSLQLTSSNSWVHMGWSFIRFSSFLWFLLIWLAWCTTHSFIGFLHLFGLLDFLFEPNPSKVVSCL
ncbi:hypothetical protein NE237_005800 [Protea cynaroides]|uniref:Uncharacterized protein n=1 Tax=Protea cynaroides TaxID=273540 RepID=A0A9Q0KLC8_9MAGN|nr:hypothetical protein NE237_005800 [Protea cynaroides]